MEFLTIHKEEYHICTNPEQLQVEVIHHFLSTQSYWSLNIPLEKVKKAIQHSLNFGVYFQQQQVGYARIISDYTAIAYLGDVFILPEHRGKGLSKWLMQTIMEYPDLQGLRRWILLTQDAHNLYKQFGWKEIAIPERWMECHNPQVYL